MGGGTGSVGNGRGHVGTLIHIPLLKTGYIIDVLLRALCDPRHGLQGDDRVAAGGRFPGQHNGAGAVVDSVSNVSGFGSGGAGVLHHGIQHLSGGDHLKACVIGFFDQLLLDNRNLLQRNFHAQVASGNHDAVGHIDDLVDVFHTILIFNFGDDPNFIVMVFLQLGTKL